MEDGGSNPGPGDRALADLLYFDSLVGNGGLGHGFDVCSEIEVLDAIDGARFFGLTEIVDFLLETKDYSEERQESLSPTYYEHSQTIVDMFAEFYRMHPDAFTPL